MSRGGARRQTDPRRSPRPSVLRRKWAAAAVGTVLSTLSFWLVAFGASDTASGARVPLVLLGLVVLGVSFMGVVAVSGAPRPFFATTLSLALFFGSFIVVVLIGLVTGSGIVFSGVIVIALGVGGMAALATNGADVLAARLWATVVVTGVTWGLLLIAPIVGTFTATLLPFGALAVVDMWVDKSLV